MKSKNLNIFATLLLISGLVFFFGCKKTTDLGSFTPNDPKLQFAAEQLSVAKNDSTYKLKFKSNLPWRTKSNNDWITIPDGFERGLEKDSVTSFRVTKNPTIQPRTGSVTVFITDNYQKIITINQAAGDPPPIIKRNVYVKVGGTGDGSSWDNATTLNAALAIDLAAGDFIHIAAGTYKPTAIVTGGTAGSNEDKTFEVRQNINVIGGYPANATTGAISNPVVNVTALDGDNTASHVVTVSAPTIANQKVLMKGVTIQKGNTPATGSVTITGLAFPKNFGGGIIVGKAVAELEDCILTDNTSVSGGGAIYAFTNATVTLRKTTVQNNKTSNAAANGGAIFMDKLSNLFTYNTTITNNAAGSFAGALYQYTGGFHMYNTTIDGNGAGGLGSGVTGKAYGGIYLREGSGEMVNCTLYGNTASNIGGGIGVFGTTTAPATLDLVSTTITANKVKGSANGAGLYVNALFCTINIYNSIISGNTKGATGTETASDIEGVAGFTWSKKNAIVGNQVFNSTGTAVSGSTFDFATMLGALTSNGGNTRTVKLQGTGNPALTNGMAVSELTTLGATLSTAVPADIIGFDQTGESRASKPYIGATVK
jgi:hypothetical protein